VVVCRLLDNFVDCSTVIDVNKVERPLQHWVNIVVQWRKILVLANNTVRYVRFKTHVLQPVGFPNLLWDLVESKELDGLEFSDECLLWKLFLTQGFGLCLLLRVLTRLSNLVVLKTSKNANSSLNVSVLL
jgi:hypothetical protein